MLRALVLDVDFTLVKPGPDLGPGGYRRLGERFGLRLDPARYEDARRGAIAVLEQHPLVVAFRLAGEGEGGWGATLDTLRPPRKS